MKKQLKVQNLSVSESMAAVFNDIFFRCVEDAAEAIMLTDVDGTLLYVNPAWQEIYEYSWEEAIGQSPRILRSGHQSREVYAKMWQDILDPNKGHWKGELINKSKSGREVPVLLTITPFQRDGVTCGYLGLAMDMSEKKKLEAAVLQQDRLASVGLLASGIAHEIGTPLGIIRGRAELIKTGSKAQTADNVEAILRQVDRISELVNNLLSLGRGQNQFGATSDVKAVIHEVMQLLNPSLKQIGIQFSDKVPSGTLVKMSHHLLQQVILNLLMNAIHAIETEVKKGRKKNHAIEFDCETDGDILKLSVRDTGCGIEQKHLTEIFQPFFTTKEIGEGTGLGLSISYQLVLNAGGQLLVTSVPGEGTTFTLEIAKAS